MVRVNISFKLCAVGACIALIIACPTPSNAQVSFSGTYSQNFDPALATWTNNSTLTGWCLYNGTGTNGGASSITVSTGTGTSGGFYSYGAMSSSDRAVGSIAASSTPRIYALALLNSSGSTYISATVSYSGEQWRQSGLGTAQSLAFDYAVTSSMISTTQAPVAGTSFSSLTFTSPNLTAGTSALNGNDSPTNKTAISATITGLTWGAGEYLVLRWVDNDDGGTDAGLSLDDMTITASATSCNAPTSSVSPSTISQCVGGSAVYTCTATGDPTLSYQWKKSGTNLVDGTNGNGSTIAGATTSQLTISNLHTGDAGNDYTCTVTSSTCAPPATSSAVSLSVSAPQCSSPGSLGVATSILPADGTSQSSVTATVYCNGAPSVGQGVSFRVISGPNTSALAFASGTTGVGGVLTVQYANNGMAGTDTIEATITGGSAPCTTTQIWYAPNVIINEVDARTSVSISGASHVVISEFRTRGPNGGNDEFVEIYNPTNSSVNISGWQLWGSNGTGGTSNRATIPLTPTTSLPPGCHFLFTNSSSSGYSGTVMGNQNYGTGVGDDGGIAILDATGSIIIDQVGMSSGSAYKEGTTLATTPSNINQSYERKPGGAQGNGQDTGNNSADFSLNASSSNPQNLTTGCVSLQGDGAEFIELYDGGAGNTSLDGLIVVLYNQTQSYSSALDLTGKTTTAGGYFVIGSNSLLATLPGTFGVANKLAFSVATDNIQDETGAVALYHALASAYPNGTSISATNVQDALVYEATGGSASAAQLSLINSGQPQVSENAFSTSAADSMQRCVNGSGGARNTANFVASTPTTGGSNSFTHAVSPPVATETTICNGGSSDLSTSTSVSAPYTVQWSVTPCTGASFASGSSVTVSPSITTSYYAQIVTAGGCAGPCSSTVTINVVQQPTVTINAAPSTVCAGSSVTLTANTTGGTGLSEFFWEAAPGGCPTDENDWTLFAQEASGSVSVSVNATTSYRVSVEFSGYACDSGTSNCITITVPVCNDGLSCTNDTCSDGNCVYTPNNSEDGDTINDCIDNCPLISNQNQADQDADSIGDVCDTCTDVDGDGWGNGLNGNTDCPNGTAVDCDDNLDNIGPCPPTPTVAVTVELDGIVDPTKGCGPYGPDPVTIKRCIDFVFFDCANNVQESASVEMEFSIVATSVDDDPPCAAINFQPITATALINLPTGNWNCAIARDRLHTLARKATLTGGGSSYTAAFTGTQRLPGGNLNNDPYIDILDFGAWAGQYLRTYASSDTNCGTSPIHGDVNGDRLVDAADFSFVSINYLKASDDSCCPTFVVPGGGVAGARPRSRPVTSISVNELRQLGMGEMAAGDVNNDGILNGSDVADVMMGQMPRMNAPAPNVPVLTPGGPSSSSRVNTTP